MTTPDTTTAKPERTWVWWCNEESIAAGKISALAVVETFAAVGAWWWLAMHFNWSIFSFVALFAAPMLLLRSPKSIRLGRRMLWRYWERKEKSISKTKGTIIVLVPTLVTGLAAHYYTGDNSFWLISLLVAGAGASTMVVAILISTAGKTAVSIAGAGSGSILAVLAYVVLSIAGGVGASGIFAVLALAGVLMGVVALLFALSILLRGQLIRWLATLRCTQAGFVELPRNWRETLLVIDLSHPPELIPQAGNVSEELAINLILEKMLREKASYKFINYASSIMMIYLPTLAYRWSLKASAWLWFPLILLLKPPFYDMTVQDISERTTLSVKGSLWVWTRRAALAVLLWLAAALFPVLLNWFSLLPKDLGEWTQKLHSLTPPPLGIRYAALCLFAGLGLWFAASCEQLKLLYGELVEKPEKSTSAAAEQFTRFQRRARTAERQRIALIVTVIVGGYAFAAMWLHDKNPAYANHFLAPWLLRIL